MGQLSLVDNALLLSSAIAGGMSDGLKEGGEA